MNDKFREKALAMIAHPSARQPFRPGYGLCYLCGESHKYVLPLTPSQCEATVTTAAIVRDQN